MDHDGIFLANVSCRISRASGGLAPRTPTKALPWICWGLKASPPRSPAAGRSLGVVSTFIPRVIYKQRIHGKTYQFWWESSRKNGWKSSGKVMLKMLYEPGAHCSFKNSTSTMVWGRIFWQMSMPFAFIGGVEMVSLKFEYFDFRQIN